MSLYILDTDHLSLQQRGHLPLLSRLARLAPDELAIAVITAEEQFRGRLAQIKRARSDAEIFAAYRQLRETTHRLGQFRILDFDTQAKQIFDLLLQQKLRVGRQDLRIAAIALAAGATVVTRNPQRFGQVVGLSLDDWSK